MGGRCGLKKKMYEEMVRQIMWTNLVEETRWSNCVEKLGGRIFFEKNWLSYYVEKLGGNLVLNVCFFIRQIGRNSFVVKSMDKMYWKN